MWVLKVLKPEVDRNSRKRLSKNGLLGDQFTGKRKYSALQQYQKNIHLLNNINYSVRKVLARCCAIFPCDLDGEILHLIGQLTGKVKATEL